MGYGLFDTIFDEMKIVFLQAENKTVGRVGDGHRDLHQGGVHTQVEAGALGRVDGWMGVACGADFLSRSLQWRIRGVPGSD